MRRLRFLIERIITESLIVCSRQSRLAGMVPNGRRPTCENELGLQPRKRIVTTASFIFTLKPCTNL